MFWKGKECQSLSVQEEGETEREEWFTVMAGSPEYSIWILPQKHPPVGILTGASGWLIWDVEVV